MERLLLVCYFFTCFSTFLYGQETSAGDTIERRKVIVGTKEAAPFSIKGQDDSWRGVSMDLWERVAETLEIDYEVREYDLETLLSKTAEGEVDVAVAALTITKEREQSLDFTYPYYVSGLGIAVREEDAGILGMLAGLFSLDFLKAAGGLIVVIFIFGFLVWLFERKRNPEQFGGKSGKGVAAAFWWSAVTMTTVGYGDKAPVTRGGRIVAFIWMFMALIIISGFTAAIASSLTTRQMQRSVQSAGDLPNVRVGTVENSASSSYLQRKGLRYSSYNSLQKALEALNNDELQAVVYDEPILRYMIKNNFGQNIGMLPQQVQQVYYGWAVPENSDIKEDLNQLMLEEIRQREWQEILYEYLGKAEFSDR